VIQEGRRGTYRYTYSGKPWPEGAARIRTLECEDRGNEEKQEERGWWQDGFFALV